MFEKVKTQGAESPEFLNNKRLKKVKSEAQPKFLMIKKQGNWWSPIQLNIVSSVLFLY